MDAVISARNLNFKGIIKYPDIDVERNKITFICGESGCGKSTLLKLFNASVSSDKGEVLYNKVSLEEADTVKLRKEVMLVSQSVFLFDGTIESNFQKYYEYRDMKLISIEEMRKYLSICCADFELQSKCETLSGGERQRVFIAVCLSLMPKVIMLDEPTSALDSETSFRFFSNIKGFCRDNEITIVTVSHDMKLAEKYADSIIKLERKAEQ